MILALDLGTATGWCVTEPRDGAIVAAGTWNLKGSRYEGGGMRFLRFRERLQEATKCVERVVYEEVRRHMGTDAAHIYGGLLAVLQTHCEEQGIPYEGIPVGTIKKHATGKGNANKDAMMAAARAKWPDIPLEDDNMADAMHIADYAATRGAQ